MKVVDMYGCGLPVCAVGFDCLSELVQPGKNGMVFAFSSELADQLYDLLRGSTREEGGKKLNQLRQGVAGFERWDSNWNRHAAPVLREAPRQAFAVLVAWLVLLALIGVAMCVL